MLVAHMNGYLVQVTDHDRQFFEMRNQPNTIIRTQVDHCSNPFQVHKLLTVTQVAHVDGGLVEFADHGGETVLGTGVVQD